MKVDTRFPIQVGITFALGIVVAVVLSVLLEAETAIAAAVVGAVLSTVNVIGGYLAIEYSIGKSQETFLKAVLGGMGIRMAILLVAVAVLIRYTSLHTIGLVSSLLGFYVVYLALEVLYIQKRVSQ
ncbi:MAG: hypothetical protein HY961_16350 [Ignavibacteriae bacterium]|nr:hypothetical protein [Ignavibacteriota bacterium]